MIWSFHCSQQGPCIQSVEGVAKIYEQKVLVHDEQFLFVVKEFKTNGLLRESSFSRRWKCRKRDMMYGEQASEEEYMVLLFLRRNDGGKRGPSLLLLHDLSIFLSFGKEKDVVDYCQTFSCSAREIFFIPLSCGFSHTI